MVREPFYGHFLVHILKREDLAKEATIGIGCPGGSIQLTVGEAYWREMLSSEALRYGAIKHQVLHLVFKHVLQAHNYGNARLFDIAADLAVNQYLSHDQCFKGAVTLTSFPGLSLEPHMDVGYYYRALAAILTSSAPSPDLLVLEAMLGQSSPDDHRPQSLEAPP